VLAGSSESAPASSAEHCLGKRCHLAASTSERPPGRLAELNATRSLELTGHNLPCMLHAIPRSLAGIARRSCARWISLVSLAGVNRLLVWYAGVAFVADTFVRQSRRSRCARGRGFFVLAQYHVYLLRSLLLHFRGYSPASVKVNDARRLHSGLAGMRARDAAGARLPG
jgi:hypothetical protein